MQTVLSSWKEIAQYIGKGVRTVQRWEREMDLPVHRPLGASKGVVLAYPSELDAWAHRAGDGSRHDEKRNDATKRNRELTLELARRAVSLLNSAQQLVDRCHDALSRLEERRTCDPLDKTLETSQSHQFLQ